MGPALEKARPCLPQPLELLGVYLRASIVRSQEPLWLTMTWQDQWETVFSLMREKCPVGLCTRVHTQAHTQTYMYSVSLDTDG